MVEANARGVRERRDAWGGLRTVTAMCAITMNNGKPCPFDAVTEALCLIHRLREIGGFSDEEMGVPFGTDIKAYRRRMRTSMGSRATS